MQTTIFQIELTDGSKFNVYCQGKNQIERFKKAIHGKNYASVKIII